MTEKGRKILQKYASALRKIATDPVAWKEPELDHSVFAPLKGIGRNLNYGIPQFARYAADPETLRSFAHRDSKWGDELIDSNRMKRNLGQIAQNFANPGQGLKTVGKWWKQVMDRGVYKTTPEWMKPAHKRKEDQEIRQLEWPNNDPEHIKRIISTNPPQPRLTEAIDRWQGLDKLMKHE